MSTGGDPPNETPMFGKTELREIIKKKPIATPQDTSKALENFSKKVSIIIHTVNDNEYWAAVDHLDPPVLEDLPDLRTSVIFPKAGSAVGMFGGYKAALVQTGMGEKCRGDIEDALRHFPNAKAIIAVGVAYGKSREKCKFGDVLVSQSIEDMSTVKFAKDGTIIERGKKDYVKPNIEKIFCKQTEAFVVMKDFTCTKEGREPQIIPGTIISMSSLVDNEDIKRKILKNSPEAIGGEMEGYVLLQIQGRNASQNPPRQIDIVVIKGVADYGDGTKLKEWQFTAAMAAVGYAHYKLEETGGVEFKITQPDATSETKTPTKEPAAATGGDDLPPRTDNQDKKPSMGDLRKLVDRVQAEWKELGRILGFDEPALKAIAADNVGHVREMCNTMLGNWLDGPGRSPKNWCTLFEALWEMGKKEWVKELAAEVK